MAGDTPLATVQALDLAFNDLDIEGVLACYETDALMVVEPNRLARGKHELLSVFERLLAQNQQVKLHKTITLEKEDLALFLAIWEITSSERNRPNHSLSGRANTILRRQTDGLWKIAIDNVWGERLLGSQH
ncbi:MAG: DUF4440 domain-containing protein [Thermostichus sp. BF3_bins_97]